MSATLLSATLLISSDGWFMGLVICKGKKREGAIWVKQENPVPNKSKVEFLKKEPMIHFPLYSGCHRGSIYSYIVVRMESSRSKEALCLFSETILPLIKKSSPMHVRVS